jgi:hypothetical protein
MKSKPFWTLAVMLLAGLGWMAVPVQAVEHQKPPDFSEVDKDKNGYISPDESVVVPGLSELLSQLDKNADGKVSKDEYAALTVIVTPVKPGSGETPRTDME